MADYVLRWTTGSLVGQEVPVRQLPFTIGRSPNASLVLDAGLGEVSAMHLRLAVIADCLCVEDLQSTNGTYLNERRVHAPVRVGPGDVVGFGKNGPRFLVQPVAAARPAAAPRPATADPVRPPPLPTPPPARIQAGERAAGGGQPPPLPAASVEPTPTAQKGRSVSLDTMMDHLEKVRGSERRRTTRLLALTTVGMLVAGVGAWWFLRDPGDIRELAERHRGSVWKVCLKRTFDSGIAYTSIGTAWTVAHGRLATNAHVAAEVDQAAPGTIVARVIRDGQPVEVTITKARSHPDYAVFHAALEKFRPTIDGHPMGAQGQFDVAVLEVADTDHSLLGSPLPVVRSERLSATLLEPLCYLGYPSENKNVDPARPDLFCLVGPCARLADPYFGAASEPGNDGLIGVQMPGAGGASGGPLLNARGEVVALLAAGDTLATEVGRVSEGICYGPSASLLLELLEAPALSRESKITARMRDLFRSSLEADGFLTKVRAELEQDGLGLKPSEQGDRIWELERGRDVEFSVAGDSPHVVVVVPEGDPAVFEVRSATSSKVFELPHGLALIMPTAAGEHSIEIVNRSNAARFKLRLFKIVKLGG